MQPGLHTIVFHLMLRSCVAGEVVVYGIMWMILSQPLCHTATDPEVCQEVGSHNPVIACSWIHLWVSCIEHQRVGYVFYIIAHLDYSRVDQSVRQIVCM